MGKGVFQDDYACIETNSGKFVYNIPVTSDGFDNLNDYLNVAKEDFDYNPYNEYLFDKFEIEYYENVDMNSYIWEDRYFVK